MMMMMMMMMILFAMIILLFSSSFLQLFRRKRYPPGPRGWPIIGNMTMMDKLTHRGLAELADKYGGVLHLRMGLRRTVAVSSPEAAREVLQLQDAACSNRPATAAITYLTYDRADMAFADYGPFWRQMRKLCVVKLFSRRRTESWESVRDEVASMIASLSSGAGTSVNVGEMVFGLTRNIVYRAAFGSSCFREGQDEFIGILQEFSKLFGAFNVADFIPWLGWVDPHGLTKRLGKARASLDGFIDRIIDEHMKEKKKKNDNGVSDMVDELLVFYNDDEETNKFTCDEADDDDDDDENLQRSMKLKRDNIKAIIMDVMFGGTETVASAIEWAMSELLKSPEDLKKVQQELADVIGLDRRVEEADLVNLTYLKCCLKETLRLHPPIPLLLHETARAVEVSRYYIPAKSRVMINAWVIGRDKNSWGNAEAYKPSRFLKDGAPDLKGNHFEFIPFGSGRRSCPGMQLGFYAVEMAVAHLCHCFTWDLPDGMEPSKLSMDDLFGLTAPRANRLIAVPNPRLKCPLF